MRRDLVLTLIGKDKPGLVKAISCLLADFEANWEASHLARLGGRFAGVIQVSVASERSAALREALENNSPEGLRVIVNDEQNDEAEEEQNSYWMELIGSDQPNIVRNIASVLAENHVTVVEITTELEPAPVSGGRLFKMHAAIACPASLTASDLRASLEELANSLMVDLRLNE